jgi:septum formation protein
VGEGPDPIDRIAPQSIAVLERALERALILASASPRRADLLSQVGIDFEVIVSDATEEADRPGANPATVAETHAREKALDVAGKVRGRLVLGADTVVVVDAEVLGKPESVDDARVMLRRLSSRGHEVVTGVALALAGEDTAEVLAQDHVTTRVEFRDLSAEEIDAYVASGEPMDKAGGYGIQGLGALLVQEIEGCYFNVVGLPLSRTWEMLAGLGSGFPQPTDVRHREA